MSYSAAQRSREIGVHLALALAVVAALLSGVAFVASFLPAHQATRVDPLVTLRSE